MISTAIDNEDGLALTLPALLRAQARRYADRDMVVCDGSRLSYAQAELQSRRLAKGLLASGAGKGCHVALLYPNGPEFVVGMLAAARIGAVAVPLSTLSKGEELRWLLAHSDAAFLLCAREFRTQRYDELLCEALPGLDLSRPPALRSAAAPWLRRIWMSGADSRGTDAGWSTDALAAAASSIEDSQLDAIESRVSPADRLAIIHTSGSTSSPKGVMHTHGALIRHLHNINQVRRLTYEDILFTTAPWFWIAGFAYSLLGTILAGGCIACSNATEASDVLDFIERERPTFTNGYAPTVARLAADPSFPKRDLSFMRRGNLHPIMPPDVRPADPALRHDIYGMSEVGGALTMSGDLGDQPERLRGSCGRVLPGFEARMVDPKTGTDCGAGELGELWLRGPLMMDGYYGRPRSEVFDADGWWHSGDIGMFDAEGFYYFRGRLGDMIKTSGANVSPREVEAVISNLTGGRQCVVLGVPDRQRGQAVVAVVVADQDGEVDEAALRQRLGERLSSYKVPRRIIRLGQSEIPTLSSGKLDMERLAALVQARR
jgi:acyl-CoA synthetase (AMP-forming)/AMP-acid ligase II